MMHTTNFGSHLAGRWQGHLQSLALAGRAAAHSSSPQLAPAHSTPQRPRSKFDQQALLPAAAAAPGLLLLCQRRGGSACVAAAPAASVLTPCLSHQVVPAAGEYNNRVCELAQHNAEGTAVPADPPGMRSISLFHSLYKPLVGSWYGFLLLRNITD